MKIVSETMKPGESFEEFKERMIAVLEAAGGLLGETS